MQYASRAVLRLIFSGLLHFGTGFVRFGMQVPTLPCFIIISMITISTCDMLWTINVYIAFRTSMDIEPGSRLYQAFRNMPYARNSQDHDFIQRLVNACKCQRCRFGFGFWPFVWWGLLWWGLLLHVALYIFIQVGGIEEFWARFSAVQKHVAFLLQTSRAVDRLCFMATLWPGLESPPRWLQTSIIFTVRCRFAYMYAYQRIPLNFGIVHRTKSNPPPACVE